MPLLKTADLFCGGGGASLGLQEAADYLGHTVQGVGVNHWPRAIEAYGTAFPDHRVYNAGVETVNPTEAVPGGELDILLAGPSCVHHSRARGGRPSSEQHRMGPWAITNWLKTLDVKSALIENVPEFVSWRPLTRKGKPDKRFRKGHTFDRWIQSVRELGYTVDWRVLCAADYGDATSRKRLFIQAIKGDVEITWPEPTHGPDRSLPYRTAREIIDWNLEGKSIFGRKRPLAENTLKRIGIGIERFVQDLDLREAFLVILRGGSYKGEKGAVSPDVPLPPLTAAGTHHGLVQSFLTKYHGGETGSRRAHSIDEPTRTAGTSNQFSLVEAFAMTIDNGGDTSANSKSVDTPLGTIVSKERHGLVDPHIVELRGKSTVRSTDEPVTASTTMGAHHALAEPSIIEVNHGGDGSRRVKSTDIPMGAQTARNGRGLLEPFITKFYGTGTAVRTDKPLDTCTTKGRFALVTPFLVHINRNQLAPTSVDKTFRTVTSSSSDIALVETGFLVQDTESGQLYLLDIRFRMLQPHELAAAMSLEGMALPGPKKDQVRLIGNAIPASIAAALTGHMITTYNLTEVA